MATFATAEEQHSEKDEGNCSSVNGQTKIDDLTNDIVSDILFRIPTKDIYNSARLVRRKWYQMIKSPNFVKSHLQHTTLGLLIWKCDHHTSRPIFVAMRKGRIEVSKLSYEFPDLIWTGCNGLVLKIQGDLCQDSYVSNPATKQRFDLPPYFSGMSPRGAALAYAPTSMVYKVVRAFFSVDYEASRMKHSGCIFTVGVDKSWRRIVNSEYLPAATLDLFTDTPLTIEGFVFWAGKGTTYLLMLDVEAEIFSVIGIPPRLDESSEYYCLSAGSCLSLLIQCTKFSWEVWKTEPETGEWVKFPNIDLEAQKCEFEELFEFGPFDCSLIPVGWLNFPEVLVFRNKGRVYHNSRLTRLCFAYNLDTEEIDSFELESDMNMFLPHRNSLVLLDGCQV